MQSIIGRLHNESDRYRIEPLVIGAPCYDHPRNGQDSGELGPNEGRKAFTLQTLPPPLTDTQEDERVAKHFGFSLHAGVAAAAHQRDKVERLCGYIARLAGLLPKPQVHLTRYHGVLDLN